jgi:hypothetical protein
MMLATSKGLLDEPYYEMLNIVPSIKFWLILSYVSNQSIFLTTIAQFLYDFSEISSLESVCFSTAYLYLQMLCESSSLQE